MMKCLGSFEFEFDALFNYTCATRMQNVRARVAGGGRLSYPGDKERLTSCFQPGSNLH